MKKIRVLHIAQAAGGVERYIEMLLKYTDNGRCENILVFSHAYDVTKYCNMISNIEQIQMNRSIGISDIKNIEEIYKIIKKYNPDILYAHSSKAGAIVRIANIFLKKKCIYNAHGWSFNMRTSTLRKKIYVYIEKIAAHFCDKIICISEYEKKTALENKICNVDKLVVINNGIDLEKYRKDQILKIENSEIGIPNDAYVIGMVGRISEQKAPDIFVRMAVLVKKTIPNVHFLIVGDGEMKDEICQYAKENKINDILHITGWVSNPESYIEMFDIACLLSRWEGFGLALAEYMACGKPIVATNVDAIPYVVRDGINGILVKKDDFYSGAQAVKKLYDNKMLADNLASNGKKIVNKYFDVNRVVNEHKALFLKLMSL